MGNNQTAITQNGLKSFMQNNSTQAVEFDLAEMGHCLYHFANHLALRN